MIEFRCPHCRSPLKLDDRLAGMDMSCPSCQIALAVPALGLAAGSMIGGYRIKQFLGCGGFGEVYQVYQLSMDRTLALKVLPRDRSADARWADALALESRALARVRHDAVVHAVDAGEAEGVRYLATWLVDGDDLAWSIGRQGRLPMADVLRIGLDAALALGHAWEQHNTAHGNLKPTNLMLGRKGEVHLLDFGLIRPLHPEAIAAMNPLLDCTANYVSPEQAAGQREPDFRTDLYSLGATLYYAATGMPPYFGASPKDIVERLIRQPLPPALKLNPAVGPRASALLASLMATERERRPSSWREVVGELEKLLKEARAAAPAPAAAPATPATAVRPKPVKTAPAVSVRMRRPSSSGPAAAPAPAKGRGLRIFFTTTLVLAAMALSDVYVIRKMDARKKAAQAEVTQAEQESAHIQRANQVRQELATVRNLLADPAADLATLRQRMLWIRKLAGEGGVLEGFAAECVALDNAIAARAAADNPLPRAGGGVTNENPAPKFDPVESIFKEPSAQDVYARQKTQVLRTFAADVLAGQITQAAQLLEETVRRHPDSGAAADLAPLQSALAALPSAAPLLAASFRPQVGQVVMVAFKTGEERLRIQEASPTGCRADRVVVDGGRVVASSARTFRYEELGVDEALARLKGSADSVPPLLGGLVAARAGARDRAVELMRQAPAPLGPLLADYLDGRLEEAPAEQPFGSDGSS